MLRIFSSFFCAFLLHTNIADTNTVGTEEVIFSSNQLSLVVSFPQVTPSPPPDLFRCAPPARVSPGSQPSRGVFGVHPRCRCRGVSPERHRLAADDRQGYETRGGQGYHVRRPRNAFHEEGVGRDQPPKRHTNKVRGEGGPGAAFVLSVPQSTAHRSGGGLSVSFCFLSLVFLASSLKNSHQVFFFLCKHLCVRTIHFWLVMRVFKAVVITCLVLSVLEEFDEKQGLDPLGLARIFRIQSRLVALL